MSALQSGRAGSNSCSRIHIEKFSDINADIILYKDVSHSKNRQYQKCFSSFDDAFHLGGETNGGKKHHQQNITIMSGKINIKVKQQV